MSDPRGPFFSTQWERDDYERQQRGEEPRGPLGWPGVRMGRTWQDEKLPSAKQAETPHHLAQFGYRRLPQWLWRTSPRAWVIVAALQDIWLIVTGRCTLHRAWQAGHDDGHIQEVRRQLNGGR